MADTPATMPALAMARGAPRLWSRRQQNAASARKYPVTATSSQACTRGLMGLGIWLDERARMSWGERMSTSPEMKWAVLKKDGGAAGKVGENQRQLANRAASLLLHRLLCTGRQRMDFFLRSRALC